MINKHNWTKELDATLESSVVRNYFNFDTISNEVGAEAKARKLNFGANPTEQYSAARCRLRWSYLHLKRKQQRPVKYATYTRANPTSAAKPAVKKQAWAEEKKVEEA